MNATRIGLSKVGMSLGVAAIVAALGMTPAKAGCGVHFTVWDVDDPVPHASIFPSPFVILRDA